ncbi:beta-galactosidase [Patescibacteria group bacterium]
MAVSDQKIGTTFSYLETKNLGLDWQETLAAILKLGLNPIRIGTYWSEIEKSPGKFDYSLQDKIIEQISKTKTEIILQVGMKAPRWPEFYLPQWLEKKINFKRRQTISEPVVNNHLFRFLKKTIKRYEKYKSIQWLNIENEPLTYSGPGKLRIAPSLLEKEVKLANHLSNKPIILNSWTEINPLKRSTKNKLWRENSIKTCLELGNTLGLSAYPKYPGQLKVIKKHWQFLGEWLRKANLKGKDAWITELQAEPWEKSDDLKNFKEPFGNQSCNPNDVEAYLKICQNLGFKTILLWGAEFWYRCLKEGNQQWWQAITRNRA